MTPALAYKPAVAFALGFHNSCAVKSNGDVFCWGDNMYQQINATDADATTATKIGGLPSAVFADPGARHVCALLGNRTVSCWGDNESGQIGNGGTSLPVAPTPVMNLSDVTQLSVGGFHSCAIVMDGGVWCWGQQIASTPVQVPLPARAAKIAAGSYHTCAILEDGSVWCWGANGYGQLGTGDNVAAASYVTPSRVTIPCD
jgi:alpha-tubulin suppressor-like RCC1 family protein